MIVYDALATGRALSWGLVLAHNIAMGCALRVARDMGWWDGAGYHRDEVTLARAWKRPENKGPAWTSGTPGAATLSRAA